MGPEERVVPLEANSNTAFQHTSTHTNLKDPEMATGQVTVSP